MSLNRLWAFLAVALPVLAALIANLSSVDLTYHLRAGEGILATGAIPRVDEWTFTAAGAPWTDQQWGAQVVLELAYRLGGWTGLAVLRAALVGVVFGCLFVIGRRRGLDPRTAALLTLAAFLVSAVALALRPQLLGMALFAVVLLLVVERRTHPRALWAVPVIVAVWANLHGSFFLGPLVLGLAWLEDVHDRDPGARRTLAGRRRQRARRVPDPVRPGGLGVRRRAVDQPAGDPADHRMAGDDAADRAGHALLRERRGDRRADRAARPGDLVADARLARGLLPHRGVRDPRRRLVAARGGDRDRRDARDRGHRRRSASTRR